MIEFKNVSKQFGNEPPILDNLDFVIDKGSFVFLVGPTGSGKTTIFRLIIKDLLPSSGTILLEGVDIPNLQKNQIPTLRRKVGVVFQDLKLLLDRTIAENVMLPLQFAGMKDVEARKKAEEVLIEVGLTEKQNKFPLQLSGGEKQRVAIARALVFDPEFILADEPTGNLDLQTSFQIMNLLTAINKKGTTIFMATHNDRILEDAGYRVLTLEKGQIKETKAEKKKPAEKQIPVKVAEEKKGEKDAS